MEKQPTFLNSDDLREWIKKAETTIDEIVDWLYGLLYYDNGYPIFLNRLSFEDLIRVIYSQDDNLLVRKKMQEAAFIICRAAKWDDVNINYLDRLLYIIGYFSAIDNLVVMIFFQLLKSEQLKQREINFFKTLHNTLLSAIESAGYDPKMLPFIRRDIDDINYAMISYYILCKYEPDEAIKSSTIIINHLVIDHWDLLNYIMEKQLNGLCINDRFALVAYVESSTLPTRKKMLALKLPAFEIYLPVSYMKVRIEEQSKKDSELFKNFSVANPLGALLSSPSLMIFNDL